jgi:hypothetical protein
MKKKERTGGQPWLHKTVISCQTSNLHSKHNQLTVSGVRAVTTGGNKR